MFLLNFIATAVVIRTRSETPNREMTQENTTEGEASLEITILLASTTIYDKKDIVAFVCSTLLLIKSQSSNIMWLIDYISHKMFFLSDECCGHSNDTMKA